MQFTNSPWWVTSATKLVGHLRLWSLQLFARSFSLEQVLVHIYGYCFFFLLLCVIKMIKCIFPNTFAIHMCCLCHILCKDKKLLSEILKELLSRNIMFLVKAPKCDKYTCKYEPMLSSWANIGLFSKTCMEYDIDLIKE